MDFLYLCIPEGHWHNDDQDRDIPYNDMRWSVFKNTGSENMFRMVRDNVFPFIKTIGAADGNAYSRFMKDAVFMIQSPRTLQRLVDGIDALDQKRTPCAENDIPDVIARWNNLDAENNRTRKDQSFFVPVEEIRANDYDLTFNKYKEVERKVVEYDAPETILAHIDDLQSQIAEGLANLKSIIK